MTTERAPPSPQSVSRYSIYLPRRDGRLSWPRLPGNAPASSWTHNLRSLVRCPNHYTTEPPQQLVNIKKYQTSGAPPWSQAGHQWWPLVTGARLAPAPVACRQTIGHQVDNWSGTHSLRPTSLCWYQTAGRTWAERIPSDSASASSLRPLNSCYHTLSHPLAIPLSAAKLLQKFHNLVTVPVTITQPISGFFWSH